MAQAGANVANTDAGTALLGQQTQAADLANQNAALQLGFTKQAAAMGMPGAQGQGTTTQGAAPIGKISSPDQIEQWAQSTFAPSPLVPPAAVRQQAYLLAMGGNKAGSDAVLGNWKMQAEGQNQQKGLGASQYYQGAAQVVNADPGQAFLTMERLAPDMAKQVKALYPDDQGDQLDKDVRAFATEVGRNVHQWSGRPTETVNGVLVDKNTNAPVLGTGQLKTGLTGAENATTLKEWGALEKVDNSDGTTSQVPAWRRAGFGSAQEALDASQAAAKGQPVPSKQGIGSGGSTSASPGASPAASQASVAGVKDPVLRDALKDPDFRLPASPVVAGRTATPAQLEQQKVTVQARTDLLKNAAESTNNAAQALQYTKAAQEILATGGNLTGASSAFRAKVSGWMQQAGLGDGDYATKWQELAKYFGNAGVQAGKTNFGSQMTEKETDLQLKELSPDTTKTPAAAKELLATNTKNLQYQIDSAARARQYVLAGNDPQSFASWNDKHYNRSEAVNGAAAKPDSFVVGKVYKDAKGNTATYAGNGKWQ
jgi:hypothetical protein